MKKIKVLLCIVTILAILNFACFFMISSFLNKSKLVQENQSYAIARTSVETVEEQEEIVDFEDGYYINEKNIKLPVLIYHAFEDVVPSNDVWNLYVSTNTFEENIKTLLEEGYTFITFDDLYYYSKGLKKLPEKNILISIDDGYANNYTKAYPILQKYNVQASIFIITDYRKENYMTWEQIKEMHDSGLVKFYSHGKQHIDYTTVSISKLKNDILESHKLLEEKLGTEILKVFAYPSGKHNKETVSALKSIGFEIQVLTKYGTVNKSHNINLTNIGRIRVQNNTTGKNIINTINNSSIY